MSPHITTIAADQVQLALVARKGAAYQRRSDASAGCRWAAMSAGTRAVGDCSGRGAVPVPTRSMLMPMHRGYLDRAVQRMRLTMGLPAIRQTFGCGLRAILAELDSAVMR